MTAGPTHYEVLGVPPSATQSAIRRAYRDLARRHHPDVTTDPAAHDRFGQIAEAYEVLSDASQRRSYDRALRSGDRPAPAGPANGAAHYTWTNIAGGAYEQPARTDLDEMYDAFFASDDDPPTAPPAAP